MNLPYTPDRTRGGAPRGEAPHLHRAPECAMFSRYHETIHINFSHRHRRENTPHASHMDMRHDTHAGPCTCIDRDTPHAPCAGQRGRRPGAGEATRLALNAGD